jgi:hypothetical protein
MNVQVKETRLIFTFHLCNLQDLCSILLCFFFPAIPALKPIVYDLFLLRGVNKADISKDLETQREVIVSMLLRLIQYYQVHSNIIDNYNITKH